AINRGPEAAYLRLLPTLWFRNTWPWQAGSTKPHVYQEDSQNSNQVIRASHHELGDYQLYCAETPPLLFGENETNAWRLFRSNNKAPYTKDGIDNYIVHDKTNAINP